MADRSLPAFPSSEHPQVFEEAIGRFVPSPQPHTPISSLTATVEHAFERDLELGALTEAQRILEASMQKLAGQASLLPFACVMHAHDYTRKQADELLRDIFSPEGN